MRLMKPEPGESVHAPDETESYRINDFSAH
jgi:hypothetical protein